MANNGKMHVLNYCWPTICQRSTLDKRYYVSVTDEHAQSGRIYLECQRDDYPRLLTIGTYLNGDNMKSFIVSMVATTGLMVAGFAVAADMPPEGKKFCSACHNVEGKKMGPGFTDVAKKYAGDKDAAGKIAASITKGGAFGWNMGMMPAKGMGAGDADVQSLAKFIAGLAPAAAPAAPTAAPVAPAKAAPAAAAAAPAATPAKTEAAAPAKVEAAKPAATPAKTEAAAPAKVEAAKPAATPAKTEAAAPAKVEAAKPAAKSEEKKEEAKPAKKHKKHKKEEPKKEESKEEAK
ncbi:MAG: c-type cytochrome [Gallionella sp.]|nr:c-type cytochrome [Gallionella sp.]